MRLTASEQKRFWSKVAISDDCWNWLGSKWANGYAAFAIKRVNRRAHRVSWWLANGNPGKLFVCHRCDNRACVRPSHLFLGTTKDNMADMVAKGRQWKPRGERNSQAKLTDFQAAVIARSTERNAVLAKRFAVSPSAVSMIKHGKRWTGTAT